MNTRGIFWVVGFALTMSACTGLSVVGGGDGGVGGMDSPVTCTFAQQACNNTCVDTRNDRANCGACGNLCGNLMVCVAGACQVQCPSTQTACNGACVDFQTDTQNCAACGHACSAGQVCNLGRCNITCGPTLATCAGLPDGGGGGELGAANYCADTANDRANCGACNNVCAAGNVCVAGVCVVSCPTGQSACSGSCSNLQSDNANCGACGNACPSGQSCANGACSATCGTGLSICGTSCANLLTDNVNCGACGTTCPAGQVCSDGHCGTTCAVPLVTCGGDGGITYCADTTIDPSNCGACGTICSLPHATTTGCTAGVCSIVRCDPDFGDCNATAADGCETSTLDSAANCGACGAACALPNVTSQSCVAGACVVPAGACSVGFADCNGIAADGCETNLRTDNANCGACTMACAAGQVCSNSVCAATCGVGLATCGTGATAFCTNTQIDPTNCGACDTVCALPSVTTNGCLGGACTIVRCDANTGDCNEVAADGCETNLLTSAASCGACGRVCVLPNATATCASGACGIATCNTGFADCNRIASDGCEVDTRTDNANCGTCTNTCGAGQVCSGAVCGTTCASGLATCPAVGSAPPFCANTAVDPANCGACGTVCALPAVSANGCAAGACTVIACNAGTGDCNATAADGCETNLQTSATSCGACGRACTLSNATSTCTGGTCALTACATGFADCDGLPADGCEVNTRTDNANCGACGRTCGAGQVCSGGVCGTTCAASLTTCPAVGSTPAYCANTGVDPNNCGSCGTVCALPSVASNGCAAGACTVVRCSANRGDCNATAADGCEAALQTSTANCGACGATCALSHVTTQSCVAGACAIPAGACAAGFVNCNGVAADGCEVSTLTDNANCGACGTVCPGGQTCNAGVCRTTCASPNSLCTTGSSTFCTNTSVDPNNCSACNNVCALAHATVNGCSANTCTVVACSAGFGDCDGVASNGCETDLSASSTNCAACGRRCVLANATSTCTTSACAVTTCNAGFANCNGTAADGCEVSTLTDAANCGSCGHPCSAGQVCSGGVCSTTCTAPNTVCSGSGSLCTNVTVDPGNCGSCGHLCTLANTAVPGCVAGSCTVVGCTAGFANCDAIASNGCETNTNTTFANCGTCGHSCASGQLCTAGACVPDPAVYGCADGTREGYLSITSYPRIASCAGGFQVPGVLTATLNPACARAAGNNSAHPTGVGCNVADLCAVGWHVCASSPELAARSSTGCTNASPTAGQFFVTRQSSTGCGVCSNGTNFDNPPCNSSSCASGCGISENVANDVFGCGSTGATPDGNCAPLNEFGNNLCSSLPAGWSCGSDGYGEARAVVLTNPAAGGALCCQD